MFILWMGLGQNLDSLGFSRIPRSGGLEIPALLGAAEDGDEILGSHAKNCDRDSTRFSKGISLMTFSLSLGSMFRGNQGILGFVGNMEHKGF